MITANDCTVHKKSYKKQTFLHHNDVLTGLYNQEKCEVDITQCVEEAVVGGEKGAVLFLDLDNFKNINDGLGRAYGDRLLKEVAIGIQNQWGATGYCYHIGGDEFVILITPEAYGSIKRILANIYTMFNQPWIFLDSECYCTVSMGVAVFPDNGTEASLLLKKAEMAMYNAKRSGRNQYKFYEDKEGTAIRMLEVESSMRQAVAEECEEFVVYYQPIVDTVTEKCISCEALIRWNSRALGFVYPGEFIPMAEYLGLINEIGDYVLERACIQCRKWNENGYPDFQIHVNLSVIQLLQNNIIKNIKDTIQRTGVNPKNLILEVTENLAINDMVRMKDIIAGIKALGVKTALDDFGTGYSSLNYIKQLDFDIVKVDKSFVDDITKDDYQQAFLELIVELSEKIGAKVCVEGVEDTSQLNRIKKIGANLIQGFYFGKPLPAEEFERKFLQN
jgi:diguanylate cyclase (GGDEF)-like protein